MILSDLNSDHNNIVEILFNGAFIRLFNGSKYLIDRFENIKIFFVRINSNLPITKVLFYWFLPLYFVVNIFVTVCISINFYCKLISQSYNLKDYIVVFIFFC